MEVMYEGERAALLLLLGVTDAGTVGLYRHGFMYPPITGGNLDALLEAGLLAEYGNKDRCFGRPLRLTDAGVRRAREYYRARVRR